MKEKEILETATREFTELTGIPARILHKPLDNKVKDKYIFLELKFPNRRKDFRVEIKNELREQQIPGLLKQVDKQNRDWLLICQYIPAPLKGELKKLGINYLEAAGNCLIRYEDVFFYINDRPVTPQRTPVEGKLWKQAGLRFLFGILVKPDLLNQPYRTMAEITGVALGNIGAFLEELKEEGFLKEGVKENKPFFFLENIPQLQNKWIELYNTVLKPKLKRGAFRFLDPALQKNWEALPDQDFYWGAEPAGAKLTGFLRPEIFTIYTNQPTTTIMRQLKLVPDNKGNLLLMDKFWHEELDYKQGLVPPLLAYAELATSLDSRNRETAERLKKKHLEK